MAINEAIATITVNTYPTTVHPTANPMNPPAKQIVAMVELKRCCPASSGIYCFGSFLKKYFAPRIIGLNPIVNPSKFEINGINKLQYCPVNHVITMDKKMVH